MTSRPVEDGYLDERGILRNLLGINDRATLALAENDLVDARAIQLLDADFTHPGAVMPGGFGADRLRAIHRWLFHDVYSWAGEFRTTGISKGADQPFAPAFLIDSEVQRVVQMTADATAAFSNVGSRLEYLTRLLAALNYVHPFRDGNGRTMRAYVGQHAADHGCKLDWGQVTVRGNAEAFRAAMRGDLDPLRGLLVEIIGDVR